MTTITNEAGLPQSLVNAIINDPYTRGDARISVTQLIKPPQMVVLEKMHREVIVEDAADRIWSLFGQAVHTILDRADDAGAIHEQRMFTTEQGWKISGAFDRYLDGGIQDYKVCSVFSVKDGGKVEWEQQQNLLACLARRNGMVVTKLQIVAILRDWRRAEWERERNGGDYPRRMVQVIDLPVWPHDEAERFLAERVFLHKAAQEEAVYKPCSPEETWFSGEQWAVMKRGGKRAVKLHETRDEADKHAENGVAKGEKYFVEHRPGSHRRCQLYCAAADFCPQWKLQAPAF